MRLREIDDRWWTTPKFRKWAWFTAAMWLTVGLSLALLSGTEGITGGFWIAAFCWWRWYRNRQEQRMLSSLPPGQPVP